MAPRTGFPLNCRTPPLLGANEHPTARPTPPLYTHLRRRLSRPPRLRAHPSPACTHPGAEGACTSHRSVPHSSSTDRHVQESTLVDPWTVHTAPTRSVTTSYLCGPGFPGASPCLKRRACIQIREVNRDLRAPAHRHLVVTGSAQLHVEVAPRSTVHWWSASNVLPYPL